MSRWLSSLSLGAMLLACGAGSATDAGGPGGPGGSQSGGGSGMGGGGMGGTQVKAPLAPDLDPELDRTVGDMGTATSSTLCPGWDTSKIPVLDLGPGDPLAMATAGRVREAINQGRAPLPSEVRAEDLVNYYRRPMAPSAAPSLSLLQQLRKRQLAGTTLPDQFELLVQVDGPPLEPRPSLALTVVVATGPSVPPETLAAAASLLRRLGPHVLLGDQITVLSTDPADQPDSVDPAQAELDLDQIATSLPTGGSSDLPLALQRAFDIADAANVTGWKRVLYVGNGYDAPAAALSVIESAIQKPGRIFLTAASVGPADSVSDGMLRSMARIGRGAYVHVDGDAEADRLFGARFGELFGESLDDVAVTVTLPWYMQLLDETTGLDPSRKLRLAPGGSVRFLLRLRACAPEAVSKYSYATVGISVSATDFIAGGTNVGTYAGSHTVGDLLSQAAPVALEELVATRAFADALKGPTPARLAFAQSLLAALPQPTTGNDPVAEMIDLLGKHPAAKLAP